MFSGISRWLRIHGGPDLAALMGFAALCVFFAWLVT